MHENSKNISGTAINSKIGVCCFFFGLCFRKAKSLYPVSCHRNDFTTQATCHISLPMLETNIHRHSSQESRTATIASTLLIISSSESPFLLSSAVSAFLSKPDCCLLSLTVAFTAVHFPGSCYTHIPTPP